MKTLRTIPPLFLLLVLCACINISPRGRAFLTLDATQAVVFEAMNTYGAAFRAGKVTDMERTKITDAYGRYQLAYSAALTAVAFNTTAATPDNVRALSNEILAIVAQLRK